MNESIIIIELAALGKEYGNKEIALKVMRELLREWDFKTTIMQESKCLNKPEMHDLFIDLKAHEFELESITDSDFTSQLSKELVAESLTMILEIEVSREVK